MGKSDRELQVEDPCQKRLSSASSWRGCSLIHLAIQYLLSTHCVPGPRVHAVLTGNPTMDIVQTKPHTGQGLDKEHHAVPSNSNLLCFNVLQASLLCKEGLCIQGSRATQESTKFEESRPTTFLPSSSFHSQPIPLQSSVFSKQHQIWKYICIK